MPASPRLVSMRSWEALAHLMLMVIFFTLAGHRLAHTFKLPGASKLLLILAVVAALVGVVLATRQGRKFAATRVLPGVRSAAASLQTVARSPVKLAFLVGGSALVTLAYIGGLAASIQAFGGSVGIVEIGAVYLGAAVIAAASPTPGGLGAIEAALVAGLTGVGFTPGPQFQQCSPTGWPPTGCQSSPDGSRCGSCRSETTYRPRPGDSALANPQQLEQARSSMTQASTVQNDAMDSQRGSLSPCPYSAF